MESLMIKIEADYKEVIDALTDKIICNYNVKEALQDNVFDYVLAQEIYSYLTETELNLTDKDIKILFNKDNLIESLMKNWYCYKYNINDKFAELLNDTLDDVLDGRF